MKRAVLAVLFVILCGASARAQPLEYSIQQPKDWALVEKEYNGLPAKQFTSPDLSASVGVTVYQVECELHQCAATLEQALTENTGIPLDDRIFDVMSQRAGDLIVLAREYAGVTDSGQAMHVSLVYRKWNDYLYMVVGIYTNNTPENEKGLVYACMGSFEFVE